MKDLSSLLDSIDPLLKDAVSNLDNVFETLKENENPDVKNMGINLDSATKRAFQKNDLSGLQKILKDANKDK